MHKIQYFKRIVKIKIKITKSRRFEFTIRAPRQYTRNGHERCSIFAYL